MTLQTIKIRGARTHNLKNLDLDLPRDKLIVITGLSGSGKSSLAFDTIFAEGQRRYVESLSTYARQFLSLMEKPDVDLIEGLSPAISIEQKTSSHNPRSTVGTVTEIYDYLRLLFARVGEPRCPEHGVALEAKTVSEMVDEVMGLPEGSRTLLLAPVVSDRKGEFTQLLDQLQAQGFLRARIDGEVIELSDPPTLKKNIKHTIEVVVDRLIVRPGNEQRLAESLETALALADDIARVVVLPGNQTSEDGSDDDANHIKRKTNGRKNTNEQQLLFSAKYACPHCGYALRELEPRLFSFNNPAGACSSCDGLGVRQFFDPERVIFDDELSLAEGAISGWSRRNAFYFSMLQSLADHYEFDVDTPFNALPQKTRKVILYGSGREVIQFRYVRHHGGVMRRKHTFEGVLPNMERRYRESESNTIRDDLARYRSTQSCEICGGSRLRIEARNVFVGEHSISELTAMAVGRSLDFFLNLKLEGRRAQIAEKIVKEIHDRLNFLANVGLEYLTLDRAAESLSGGEAQRIRLASQIGSGLVGVMYILDEPSIGLHQRDNSRLLNTLVHLRDLGNTIIVVEHDEEAILGADLVVDIGPGAGVHGGEIVAQGTPDEICRNSRSLTGKYLSGIESIPVPERRTPIDDKRMIRIHGASGNNLKHVDVDIPVGLFTCVTGVSGSGKSTLINQTLYPEISRCLHQSRVRAEPHISIEGLNHFDKIIDIDQSPIGRTPRSNPATYTGLFTPIRELFSSTPESRARGYKPGRFSFNVKGGRCEACEGDGLIRVEMHFLPDVYVSCDVCRGARYNRETLDIHYKGKTISDVLQMTIEDAAEFFSAIPVVKRKLDTLLDVGLSYITLGQSATTLSGGEAQRIKLARELSKRDTGRTLYILDEPTTGLHFHDIRQLLLVLHRLRDHGNTVVVIEHNLDVIKTADWIVDLGPEGGDGGGEIVATGTPEDVAHNKASHTGHYLATLLSQRGADTDAA
ncbi:MAG: UvrABC system protein A [marine bacterium B5-7]|nr:MAG: UvrABC system protein A [marine bacterium B5-7]